MITLRNHFFKIKTNKISHISKYFELNYTATLREIHINNISFNKKPNKTALHVH